MRCRRPACRQIPLFILRHKELSWHVGPRRRRADPPACPRARIDSPGDERGMAEACMQFRRGEESHVVR
jgi:hypothetical protein